MQGSHFTIPFHVTGTLAANVTFIFTAPFDFTIKSVQAVGTNANDGKITLGTTSTADAYLTSSAIGDSSVPVQFSRSSFVGTEYPHIAKDTVVQITVDFDGSSGTATQNLSVVLFCTEG